MIEAQERHEKSPKKKTSRAGRCGSSGGILIWIHRWQVQTLLVARSAGTVKALGAEVGAAVTLHGDVLGPAPTDALLRTSLLSISAS